MTIPDLRDLLNFLYQLPFEIFILLFFLTGSLLVLVRDWRASVATLLVQYLAMGMVLAQLVRPEIAMAKVLVGLFICPILYLSARQASWRRQLTLTQHGLRALLGQRTLSGDVPPPGRTFRLMAVLLLGVTAFSLARTYPISNLPAVVSIAIYWLTLSGLLILILTEAPLKIGQGLLTAITGFELWYTTLERSLLIVGLWGAVNLLLALAIGYLMAVRGVKLEEDF